VRTSREGRLGDLELGFADAVPVADAHLVVRQPVDGEVLPELAELEIVALENLAPVRVGLRLIDEDRPLLPAVPLKVTLAVSVDVETAHHQGAVDGMFPRSRVYRPAAPGHVLRSSHIE
jgi:hypothetical protein